MSVEETQETVKEQQEVAIEASEAPRGMRLYKGIPSSRLRKPRRSWEI